MKTFLRGSAVLLAIVLAGGAFALVGCGSGSQGEGKGQMMTMAKGINDGARPMAPMQTKCPVCDAPINPDIHTESKEERVYFDKESCLKKWQEDPDKYKGNLPKRGGVMPVSPNLRPGASGKD